MADESAPGNRSILGTLLRACAAVAGICTIIALTHGLLTGRITYSVGEVETVTVTTSGLWDTLLVYLMFCPFGAALLLAGISPRSYLESSWIWKTLLGVSVTAYLLSGIFEI